MCREASCPGSLVEEWDLNSPPVQFRWMQINDLKDQSYRWPNDGIEEYDSIWHFRGGTRLLREIFSSEINLGIGFKSNYEIDGFVLSRRGTLERGIVRFRRTDDFAFSNQLISIIRTARESGISEIGLDDQPPAAYANFKLDSVGDRVAGLPQCFGVLMSATNAAELPVALAHTAHQARVRGLV